MKIKQIKISKLLSFGTPQELKDLGDYNLLIGKNGTGKTNVFKILKELPVEFIRCPVHNTFQPQIYNSDKFRNTESRMTLKSGHLEIEYYINLDGKGFKKEIIKYKGDEVVLHYVQGDITLFKKQITYIKCDFPTVEAQINFNNIKNSDLINLLNFGVYYIFDKQIKFLGNGKFTQNKNPGAEDEIEFRISALPTGILQFVKIFVQDFFNSSVLLLDEPELHLEPRSVRKFLYFFIWLICKNKPSKNQREEFICQDVDTHIKNKDLQSDLKYEAINQLFIASHSPIFINEFTELGNSGSIYEFSLSEETVEGFMDFKKIKKHQPFEQHFSKIRKIEKEYAQILSNLGSKGSDLLQANGIIWVEGPSDIIYIQKWLELYAKENNLIQFFKGIDYEFSMYGGALLTYLFVNEGNGNAKNELVNLLKINTNNFLITDSDREKGCEKPNSTFEDAKKIFKETLGDDNYWCDTDLATIEMYCLKQTEKTWKYHPNCKHDSKDNKVEKAFRRIKLWEENNVSMSQFHPNLINKLEKLYNRVRDWNY